VNESSLHSGTAPPFRISKQLSGGYGATTAAPLSWLGALMSHAVIVSRELGIPCVVAVQNATDRIVDGAMLEVDGTAGTVKVLEMPGARKPADVRSAAAQ
jgi:phosphoenolpyruvate-protein kinase (PTS system EI component)